MLVQVLFYPWLCRIPELMKKSVSQITGRPIFINGAAFRSMRLLYDILENIGSQSMFGSMNKGCVGYCQNTFRISSTGFLPGRDGSEARYPSAMTAMTISSSGMSNSVLSPSASRPPKIKVSKPMARAFRIR